MRRRRIIHDSTGFFLLNYPFPWAMKHNNNFWDFLKNNFLLLYSKLWTLVELKNKQIALGYDVLCVMYFIYSILCINAKKWTAAAASSLTCWLKYVYMELCVQQRLKHRKLDTCIYSLLCRQSSQFSAATDLLFFQKKPRLV